MVIDAIESNLYRKLSTSCKRKPPKAVELINLSSILNNPQLVSLLKDLSCNFVTRTLVYNLQQPISSSIFNSKKSVSYTNVDQFLTGPSSTVCKCVNSPFKDSDHCQIVTGDPKIIKDSKLRKLFSKDPRHLEPKKIDFDQARENIVNGIEDRISGWGEKHGIPDNVLLEWKNKLIELITKLLL